MKIGYNALHQIYNPGVWLNWSSGRGGCSLWWHWHWIKIFLIYKQTLVQVHLRVLYFTSTLVAKLSTSTSTITENDNVLKYCVKTSEVPKLIWLNYTMYQLLFNVHVLLHLMNNWTSIPKIFYQLNGIVDRGRNAWSCTSIGAMIAHKGRFTLHS